MGCRCVNLKRLEEKFGNKTSIKPVYLDYAASTPVDVRVIGEWERVTRNVFGNPSSFHQAGLNAANEIESAREIVAGYLHASPNEIYFCSGGTEALHCAIAGLKTKETHYITTVAEHTSVNKSLEYVSKSSSELIRIGIDTNGRIILTELESAIKPGKHTVFVYSPVNHETGVMQDISEIYRIVKKNNGFVIMDGMQTIGKIIPDEWVDFADCIALSGHKFYSVKGSGILLVRNGLKLHHFRQGGGQERGLFPGTENTAGIAALGKAVSILQSELKEELVLLKQLTVDTRGIFEKNGLKINSPSAFTIPGIINISTGVADIEKLLIYLSQNGICVSRFSACSKNIQGPSEILLSMGVDPTKSSDSLRISFGRYSTRDDMFRFIKFINNF